MSVHGFSGLLVSVLCKLALFRKGLAKESEAGETLHTLVVDTDSEICWDQWQITLSLCLSFPVCKIGE